MARQRKDAKDRRDRIKSVTFTTVEFKRIEKTFEDGEFSAFARRAIMAEVERREKQN